MTRQTGTYRSTTVAGERVEAFIPYPLPPAAPSLALDDAARGLHDSAAAAVRRLAVAGRMAPSREWFMYGFARKEAVITSEIEGTQTTLRDVVTFEATKRAESPADVEEVCNYVAAMRHCRSEMSREGGPPLSTRLLCEAHRLLMRGVRGNDKAPGELRRVQNWIGAGGPSAARFIPPPQEDVPGCMEALERWMHADDPMPPLVRAGVAHVQFETIHPFLDGNGRIGRLLIALLLEHWGVLDEPLLFISAAIRRRQREYYERLSAVRSGGDWEGWTVYFLECVRDAADEGVEVIVALSAMRERHRSALLSASSRGAGLQAIRLAELLATNPVVTLTSATKLLRTTKPTADAAVRALCRVGVLEETTGRQRDRVYAYREYLDILTGSPARA